MNGSAPNCSAIGSHSRVKKTCNPNLSRASAEPCHNSKISNSVTSTTEMANKNVISRAISSPSRSRLKNEREPAMGPALGTVVVAAIASLNGWLLNLSQRDLFFGNHFLRQPRVRQLLGVVLSVREHPVKEAFDRIALCGIAKFLRNQQPRKSGNRIGLRARWIRDRHSKIIRHRLGCGCCRLADAGKIRLNKTPRRILHAAIRNII